MDKYFCITLGQKHTHRIGGRTFDCDTLMLVQGNDKASVRKWAREELNNQYYEVLTILDALENIGYFPKGIVNSNAICV